jgi:DNA-binding transcriptional ArsR family regulator
MNDQDLLQTLKALAHGTRLQMLKLLLSQRLCVRALASCLGISEAAASQHLRVLREAQLVKGEKIGYWTHYQVQTSELKLVGQHLSTLPEQETWPQDLELKTCAPKHKDCK